MDLISTKLLCLLAVFCAMLLSALLPIRVITGTTDNKRTTRLLSYSNCLAGGVFLGTCFISLFPTVKIKFTRVLVADPTQEGAPVAELTIMMGYFLMLFMEQIAEACSHQPTKDESKDGVEMRKHSENKRHAQNNSEERSVGRIDIDSEEEDEAIYSREVHPLSDLDLDRNHGGHSHESHGHSHSLSGSGLRRYMLLLALSIHSVFEGTALGLQETMTQTMHLFFAILLHEILVAFAFGVSLAKLALKRCAFVQMVMFFSAMIPVGICIGIAVGNMHGFVGALTSAILQGLAAGTFIYVVFVEILPNELIAGENNVWKILCVFIGFITFSSLQFITIFT